MNYRTPIYVVCAVAMMVVSSAGMTWADAPIGEVSQPNTKDAVAIPATGGAGRALHYQAAVYENDTIVTRDNGTELQFTDQSLLNVSSNSRVVLDSFVFDKNTGSLTGTVKLGVGVFRLVTGALVKHDNLQLVTPVTTLTIRGTYLIVSIESDGTTRLRMYEGAIRLKTCSGAAFWVRAGQRVVVSPTCAATVESILTGSVVKVAGNDGGDSRPSGGPSSPPGGGGSPPGGGGNPPGGPTVGSGSNDPGTGNGNQGNGGVDNGKGNSGDPGNGRGNNPGH
jgi:FecR protein